MSGTVSFGRGWVGPSVDVDFEGPYNSVLRTDSVNTGGWSVSRCRFPSPPCCGSGSVSSFLSYVIVAFPVPEKERSPLDRVFRRRVSGPLEGRNGSRVLLLGLWVVCTESRRESLPDFIVVLSEPHL